LFFLPLVNWMSRNYYYLCTCFMILAVAIIIPPVSAWTIQNWAGPANGATLSPGTAVNAAFVINFDSWSDGAFDADNSITLYSDLTDAQWTATKTVMVNDETPITTQLVSRKSVQVKLTGWDLTDSENSYKVTVQLTGTVPALNATQDITLIRIQEVDSGATAVSGSVVKKTVSVLVPTPEPTAAPVIEPQDTVLEITPEQTAAPTTVPVISPTKKQTYAPGPDPLMICGALFCLIIFIGMAKHRK
jgi:hypothetical protein